MRIAYGKRCGVARMGNSVLRSESQLKHTLGEPKRRYNISGQDTEIWDWPCSCLAVRVGAERFQWSPCEKHRPKDWEGWRES